MGLISEVKNVNSAIQEQTRLETLKQKQKRIENEYKRDIRFTLKDNIYLVLDEISDLTINEQKKYIIRKKDEILENVIKTVYNKMIEDTEYCLSGGIKKVLKHKYNKDYLTIVDDTEMIFYKIFDNIFLDIDKLNKLGKNDNFELIYETLDYQLNEILENENYKKAYETLKQVNAKKIIANSLKLNYDIYFEKDYEKAIKLIKKKYEIEINNSKEKSNFKIANGWKAYGIAKGLDCLLK